MRVYPPSFSYWHKKQSSRPRPKKILVRKGTEGTTAPGFGPGTCPNTARAFLSALTSSVVARLVCNMARKNHFSDTNFCSFDFLSIAQGCFFLWVFRSTLFFRSMPCFRLQLEYSFPLFPPFFSLSLFSPTLLHFSSSLLQKSKIKKTIYRPHQTRVEKD